VRIGFRHMKSKVVRLIFAGAAAGVTLGAYAYFAWGGVFTMLRLLMTVLLIGYAVRRRSLAAWIIVGTAAGAEFGYDLPFLAVRSQVLGTIFLRLIKVMIAPLLFGTLVVGIAGHSDLKKVGRIGIKSLIYFEVVSTLALVIGFIAIGLTHAGIGIHLAPSAGTGAIKPEALANDVILNIFPENIVKSIADGQILQVVIFCILFGVALAMVPETKRKAMVDFASSLAETMFKFTNLVMLAAPIGIFGAVAYTVGHLGIGVFLPCLKLLITMYLALAAFVIVVLLPVALIARVPLGLFTKAVAEPLAIAFGTASSEAALPLAMEQMEAVGVSRETVALVLPTGYSFNLAGSGLYQSVALVFVAEAAGIHLSFHQQAVMLLTLLISSKGTAGVARGALVVVFAVAGTFRLPMEPIFLLFGIDQLMDMGRTAINVLGNCLATVVVARWEGESKLFGEMPAVHYEADAPVTSA
jgi:proton glutamate symport protein